MSDFVMWRSEGSRYSKHGPYWLNATYFWRPHLASGFPTGFTVDSRTRPQLNMTEPEYAQLAKYHVISEAVGAARLHFVASPQELLHTLIDVIVDRPVCLRSRSVAEVCGPAP